MIHSIVITCSLAAWLFGSFQRINTRLMSNQKIEVTDYLHMIITLSALIIPLAYFYCIGQALSFLSGFSFAYIVSTLSTFCMVIILAPRMLQNPFATKMLPMYAIFLSAPSTIAMLSVSIFLKNSFMIGAACAIASSWIGYAANLDESK
jgi:hypothetical protein